jgi:thermitase
MNLRKFALSTGLLLAACCCLRLPGGAQAGKPPRMVANEVLVGMRPTSGGNGPAAPSVGAMGAVVKAHPALHAYRIHLSPGVSLETALAQLKKDPKVLYAEPNRIVHAYATPNDTDFAQQYAPVLVQADFAWDIWRPLANVTIAVIDSGVDTNHPDLANSLLRDENGAVVGYNAITRQLSTADDDNGHGTHCTGIAAAQINNNEGIAGIAGWIGDPNTSGSSAISVMPIKALGSDGTGTDDDIAAGIIWAADHGAKVISMSLGRNGPASITLDNAVQYAWGKGCILVAAAGNDGTSCTLFPSPRPMRTIR